MNNSRDHQYESIQEELENYKAKLTEAMDALKKRISENETGNELKDEEAD